MALPRQGNFTFNHADQQDDLYKVKTALEIKQDFDSRGNELKTALNSLIDSLTAIVSGNSGADNIGVTAIQDLTGTTVQSILKSLRDTLKSVTNGTSGADFINSAPITGVSGSTLYTQLSSLKSLIDAVYTKSQLDNGQLDTRYYTETELNNGQLDTRYYTETELGLTTSGSSGAKKIGATPIATSPSDVQGILEWLKNQMDSTVLGQIPDGSVTIPKLSFDPATQVELEAVKSSVSDGKTIVKNAITGKGGTVLDADGDGFPTHQELADGVNTIQTSVAINGTAVDSDVLTGKTYYNTDAKTQRTGTLALTGTSADADVLSGKTYYNTDAKTQHTGTMIDRGAMTITPGTTDQIIPAGKHNGSGVVPGDVDLIAANIVSGKSIFGVAGNVTPKKVATGNFAGGSAVSRTVSGLTFRPQFVWVYTQDTTSGTFYLDVIFLVDSPYRGQFKDGNNINRTINGVRRYDPGSGGTYISEVDSANFDILNDGFKVQANGTSATHYWVAIG